MAFIKNKLRWYSGAPAKLLASVLLCGVLVACGGGGGGSNNNNGNGNGPELPDPSVYNLSCEGVIDGSHDGVCFEVEGEKVALFNRAYAIEDRSDAKAVGWFEGWEADGAGAVSIDVPTGGQNDFTCGGGYGLLITLPTDRTGYLKSGCLTTLNKSDQEYRGTFMGSLAVGSQNHTISNGYFRFTLWGQGDFIEGAIDGSIHRQEKDFRVWQYLPTKRLLLGESAVAADDWGDRWVIFIRDLDLLEQGPVSGLTCDLNGSYVSYIRETANGSEQNRYEMTSCQMSFEKQGGRLTGSFNGKMYDISLGQDVDYSGEFNVTLPTTPVRYGYPIP